MIRGHVGPDGVLTGEHSFTEETTSGDGLLMVALMEAKRFHSAAGMVPYSATERSPYPGAFVPFETTGWAFNRAWHTDDDALTMDPVVAVSTGSMPRTVGRMRRFMLALFMLVQQEVGVLAPFKPDRAGARRMARTNPNFGDVQIMRLRRIYDPLVELTPDERAERKRLDCGGHTGGVCVSIGHGVPVDPTVNAGCPDSCAHKGSGLPATGGERTGVFP